MQTVKVGFSRPKKWKPFAQLIMLIYGTPYDHVYVKLHSDSYDRDIIYQASGLMINFMGTAVFETDNIVLEEFSVDISDEARKSLMIFAIDNAGKPYSIKEAIGLGLVEIARRLGIKISNPLKSGHNEYVCSILAAYILEQYTAVDPTSDFESTSPRDIYQYLSSLKK